MTPQEQEALVYQAICDIAAHCDGAQSLDGMGFNGQDTKFGRRIAGEKHENWTPDVQLEANHIVLKYRQQVLVRLGLDVATLQVVKDAQDNGTNYKGRNDALGYEKRAKHLADRQIGVVRNSKGHKALGIRWANGDPEFSTFLGLVKTMPGRDYLPSTKTNAVSYSPQVAAFIDEYGFTVTEAAQAFIAEAQAAPAPQPEVSYEVWLGQDGRVRIKTNLTAPGQPAADAVRMLPGRSFDRVLYANAANATPQVLSFARQFGLQVHPDAVRACEAAGAALVTTDTAGMAQSDLDTVLNTVSRTGKPEDLPEAFVLMLREILP